jgi:hypothetical protein
MEAREASTASLQTGFWQLAQAHCNKDSPRVNKEKDLERMLGIVAILGLEQDNPGDDPNGENMAIWNFSSAAKLLSELDRVDGNRKQRKLFEELASALRGLTSNPHWGSIPRFASEARSVATALELNGAVAFVRNPGSDNAEERSNAR